MINHIIDAVHDGRAEVNIIRNQLADLANSYARQHNFGLAEEIYEISNRLDLIMGNIVTELGKKLSDDVRQAEQSTVNMMSGIFAMATLIHKAEGK
jgi:ribosomal protein L11 methylase PrmA